MKREELETFLSNNGWTRDRFGHYHKGENRFKMQDKSARLESSYSSWEGKKQWMKLRIGYYGQLTINNGKLSGMKR